MSSPLMPKGGLDSSTFIPRVSRSVLSELELSLRRFCVADETRREVSGQARAMSGDRGEPQPNDALRNRAQRNESQRDDERRTATAPEQIQVWCEIRATSNAGALPSPVELELALRTIRHSAEAMADLKASALTSNDVDAFYDVIAVLEGRIGAYERDFEALVDELRRAKLEAEEFKRRSASAESKLEVLTSAVGRVFMMPKGAAAARGEVDA